MSLNLNELFHPYLPMLLFLGQIHFCHKIHYLYIKISETAAEEYVYMACVKLISDGNGNEFFYYELQIYEYIHKLYKTI